MFVNVMSRVDYCNTLQIYLPEKCIYIDSKGVQNAATKLVRLTPKRNSITHTLRESTGYQSDVE